MKDPWKKRDEVSERLDVLAGKIREMWISESRYCYGEDPEYVKELDKTLKSMERAVDKLEGDIDALHND